MKVKINKKLFVVIISMIIIIAIMGIGIGVALPMIQFNQLKNTLSQINVEELETRLMKELENSKFNIEETKGITDIAIQKTDGYVGVFVKGEEMFDFINIPILKVDSDNNGKFKGVEYIPVFYFGEYIDIESIIFNILENEFNIKGLNNKNIEKLIQHNKNNLSYSFTNDRTLLLYINEINTREDYQNIEELEKDAKEWNKTDYFGINIDK